VAIVSAEALAGPRGYPRVVMFAVEPPYQRGALPSPLAGAALALVGDGATPADLAERFAGAGAAIDAARATAILGELAGLGLVRVARHRGDDRFHVLTSLGRQMLSGSLGSDAGVVGHLAELERLRTDLLSTIAHELRTPLTAVRTCVGVLRDAQTAPSAIEVDTLLGTIERNADRMQRVVGDILEIARFRTGQVVLQLRPFDASAMARGAIASVAPLAAKRGQSIKVDVPGTPVRVFGDHRRLEQALVNLISNAVTYGPEGGTITVRVRSVGSSVTWTVTDQGPGIPVNEQAHLFERFFVGQSDRKRGGGGVGLGLPTALAIAQAHGGGIDVTSVPGYGSVFSIVVPAEGPPDAE
jgi:signal transduction histidine kinase